MAMTLEEIREKIRALLKDQIAHQSWDDPSYYRNEGAISALEEVLDLFNE